MTPREKALRSQDIQAAIDGVASAPAPVLNELDTILLTGMATRLATHIRGTDVFGADDIQRLKLVASNLGVEGYALPQVLSVLEEAEMVQVKNSGGGKIIEVRESVPEFGDLYDHIGQVFEQRDRTEVEDATIETFHQVVGSPRFWTGDTAVEQLSDGIRVPLLDLCDQASLIRTTTRDKGRDLMYSPQYWEEHAARVPEIMEAYGEEAVANVIQAVRDRPGTSIPVTSGSRQGQIIKELADFGVLPSPAVTSWRGTKSFAFTPFTPQSDDPLVMNKILEKTRAIIACVRYGEKFGTITTLRDPVLFLEKFLSYGKTGSHSEIPSQYRILLEAGIARVSRDANYPSRFHLHLIKNNENVMALESAISLMKFGVPVEAGFVDKELHEYARMEGEYQAPPTARAKRLYTPTNEALRSLRATVLEIVIAE